MKQSEIAAYRKKILSPAIYAAKQLFSSPQGKEVLEALDRAFTRNLVAKDGQGAVDANAVLIRVGNKQVIDYLRDLAEYKEDGHDVA